MKSYEESIRDFLQGVKMTESIDYMDKKSIEKNNTGVYMYRKNAEYIINFYPDKINDFLNFLNHKSENVRVCCAVCVIEFMQVDEIREAIIKNILQNYIEKLCLAEKMGWHIWLEKYKLL
jgi:hypothetical protein